MTTWQSELRDQLDRVPGGAERLIRAIDEGRINCLSFGDYPFECGTRACAYGHIYGHVEAARDAAAATRRAQHVTDGTALEYAIVARANRPLIRAEVVCWLAEHGSTLEPLGNPLVQVEAAR